MIGIVGADIVESKFKRKHISALEGPTFKKKKQRDIEFQIN